MEMILITKEELNSIIAENMERVVSSFIKNNHVIPKKKPLNKEKNETCDLDKELSNWIPLHDAWKMMNIKKNMWYSTYKKIIRHKPHGKLVWVYKPSIYDFFITDNINKKAN